jgi:aryl-alcohol dehydrogenase-like predicted oxidoreductase
MMQSLEASLKRLGTDYVDLYLVHAWDFLTPVEEVMRAFDDLVRAGKVLYIGMSDVPAWVVAQANTLAECRGWTPLVAVSAQYNLVERTAERDLLPMAEARGLSITAWSPLAAGLLSGKYTEQKSGESSGEVSPEPRRLETLRVTSTALSGRNRAIIRELLQVAAELERPPSQVALAWLRAQSPALIPILSARTAEQFQENLACLALTLSPEQLQRLDDVSRISLGFPLDFLPGARSLVYGNMFETIDSERLAPLLKAIANEQERAGQAS